MGKELIGIPLTLFPVVLLYPTTNMPQKLRFLIQPLEQEGRGQRSWIEMYWTK